MEEARRRGNRCYCHDFKNALTSDLQLVAAAARDELALLDDGQQGRAVAEAAEAGEDLGHAVVGEGGDLVDVAEGAVGLAAEAGPQVRRQDLRPLEEPHRPPARPRPRRELVPEAREVPRQQVHQRRRRPPRRRYAVREAAAVFLRRPAVGFTPLVR